MPLNPKMLFPAFLILAVTAASAAEGDRLSKLEARRFRQACAQLSVESAVKAPERETFINRCIERRIVRRPEARECRDERQAKGIDAAHAREFMRECVRAKAEARK